MRPPASASTIQRRLGAAHLSLALLTLLAAGWLQSDLAPAPWWRKDISQLGPLANSVAAWRFAAVGYLLLTVLVEWRSGVELRRGLPRTMRFVWGAVAAHGLVLASVCVVVARGTASRALLADMEEWLAVIGVAAMLAGALQIAGLKLAADETSRVDGASSSRRQFLMMAALVVAAALQVMALGVLETIPQSQATVNEVTVYAALDSEFSEPILEDFTRDTGIAVRSKFDVESTKTVGLTQLIIAEQERPRCDVFWNNEILNTLRLQQRGLIEAHIPPQAEKYPAEFRAADGAWHGFAARARVLLVNTDLVPAEDRPTSIRDLADERWRGRCGLAKPLFGTTATHAACLFAAWGPDEAQVFFRVAKANGVQIMSGNKQVALSVAAGELAFGLTDTDDAIIEVEQGRPVAIVYPDQQEGALGTLFIPNTLCIIRGGPHPAQATRLVDYLLTLDVEQRLAACASAQIPLHRDADAKLRVETPQTIRAMQIDFDAALKQWDVAAEFIRDEFTAE